VYLYRNMMLTFHIAM